jgi:hypothetical protein
MEDYADIYYVDTRNADPRDHRVVPRRGWSPGPAPVVAHTTRPLWAQPHQRPIYAGQAPVIYSTPIAAPQNPAAMLFGKLTTGQVIEMVAQLFAALQPLPGAPTATGETSTDVCNSLLYQTALAQHAKRDEQVRTLGAIVSRLVG